MPEREDLRSFLRTREALIGRAGELLVALAALGLLVSLFLPWYEAAVEVRDSRPRVTELNGWEAFELADVVLALMAALGLASFVAARLLLSRLPYVIAAHAGWFAVVVVVYAYWRPEHLGGLPAYPGPPGGGFFLALWAAGALTGGALTALLAPRPEAAPADEAAAPATSGPTVEPPP